MRTELVLLLDLRAPFLVFLTVWKPIIIYFYVLKHCIWLPQLKILRLDPFEDILVLGTKTWP